MDYDKIATVATSYTNELSEFIYIIAGTGVVLNYYIPNLNYYIPILNHYIPILNAAINGMHWFVLMSVLGMCYKVISSRKALHDVIGKKCHSCESSLLYTSLKCSNPDCNYKIKLNTKSK